MSSLLLDLYELKIFCSIRLLYQKSRKYSLNYFELIDKLINFQIVQTGKTPTMPEKR